MGIRKRTTLVGIVALFACILTMLLPTPVPTASAHTLMPLRSHSIQGANSSGPHHLTTTTPLSFFSNCNLDASNQASGVFSCGVENLVAPGCLRERSQPIIDSSDLTGNCFTAGTVLPITCQTRGDLVINTDVWDALQDGGFVTDYYMDTSGSQGAFSPPIPTCGGCCIRNGLSTSSASGNVSEIAETGLRR